MFEPEPLKWFPNWSAGKILTALWTFFSFTMYLGYTCNLRAFIITTTYEKPIQFPIDILERGATMYIPVEAVLFWPSHFSFMGEDPIWVKVTELAIKTGGNFSLYKSKGRLPQRATKDIFENGACHICRGNLEKRNPNVRYKRNNLFLMQMWGLILQDPSITNIILIWSYPSGCISVYRLHFNSTNIRIGQTNLLSH